MIQLEEIDKANLDELMDDLFDDNDDVISECGLTSVVGVDLSGVGIFDDDQNS